MSKTLSRWGRPRNRRKRKSADDAAAVGMARAWRLLRQVASVVVAAAVVSGAVVAVRYGWAALRTADVLRLRVLDVRGAERTQRAELLAYAGAQLGAAMFDLDLDAMAWRLRRHPWVQRALVRRRWPDALTIEVVEHRPGIIVSLGDVYLANSDGRLFKRFAAADHIVLPVLTGLSRDLAAKQPEELARRVRRAMLLAEELAPHAGALGLLEEVHWDEALGWSVVTRAEGELAAGLQIHLGEDPSARLPVALQALQVVQASGRVPAVIWADGATRPDRVQVRLVPAQAPVPERRNEQTGAWRGASTGAAVARGVPRLRRCRPMGSSRTTTMERWFAADPRST